MKNRMLAEFEKWMDPFESYMVEAVQEWIAQGCPSHNWHSGPSPDDGSRFHVVHDQDGTYLCYERRQWSGYAQRYFWSGLRNWRTGNDRMHPLEAVGRVLEECKIAADAEKVEDQPNG